MSQFQKIDDEGFLISDEGMRLGDEAFGKEFLASIHLTEAFTLKSKFKGMDVFVEAADEPYVVRHLEKTSQGITGLLPYDFQVTLDLNTLCLDEWDRVHGLTSKGVPFVLGRAAQVEFFDLLEEFEDDFIVIDGTRYPTPPYFLDQSDLSHEKFWTAIYKGESEPGWDLGEPAPALTSILPQLKLGRQRVLVLGCGRGHDAAHFASKGHLVTAVDFSPTAIQDARSRYAGVEGLQFLEADAFNLPFPAESFDLIFEHTCFCAVDPIRRGELIQVWRRMLAPGGHVLGVFFTMSKRIGPPYGGSEFELRERFRKYFDFRYWTRWRLSIPRRQGKELVVYMEKKTEKK